MNIPQCMLVGFYHSHDSKYTNTPDFSNYYNSLYGEHGQDSILHDLYMISRLTVFSLYSLSSSNIKNYPNRKT